MISINKYIKFILGIAVLIMALVVFACSMKSADNLENTTLHEWRRAPLERRTAAITMIAATDANIDILTKCVDKMATLDGSEDMMVRDAVSLCYTGLQLKEHL